MRLGLLYSGGKDSSLAALVLRRFYDVTLVTAHFGVTDDWRHAREAAETLGFDFTTLELDGEVADRAIQTMREDGFPRHGIEMVHEHALEQLAAHENPRFDTVADGTRRDDRVPTVSRAQAQRLEERHDVDYIAPLSGFGRRAVDRLVEAELEVTTGPSETIRKADYESELRALLAERYGENAAAEVFPESTQTFVEGLRD
ncbi:MAG: asparagine synthase-related protein [Halodesulfurarchaeum sp.]